MDADTAGGDAERRQEGGFGHGTATFAGAGALAR